MDKKTYQSAMHQSPVGFAYHKVVTDEAGKPYDYIFLDANPAFGEITGLEVNKIIGESARQIFPELPNDHFDWIGFYGTIALEGGNKYIQKYSEPLKKWLTVKVFSDEKYYFTTLTSDIKPTQNKEEYNTPKDNFRELVENLNEVIYKLNHKAEIIYISPNIEIISGYSAKYLTGRKFTDLVHPEDRENRIENFKKALAGYNKPTKYRFLTKSGQTAWVQTNARPIIRNNKPVGIQGVLTNITEKKKTEQKLEENRNEYKNQTHRLSALLSSLPGGVLIETPQREVLFVNQKFCELFNIDHPTDKITELRENSEASEQLFVDENQFIANSQKIQQKEQSALTEEIELKDGRFFERDFVPVEVESGEYEYLWHYRDITQRKKAEVKIRQANKELKEAKMQAEESDNLKSAFLANMSHEIRTPMNAVVGFSNIILEENLSKEEIREAAEIISTNGNHLLQLINDIIDIAKIDAGELSVFPEEVNVNSLIEELNSVFQKQLQEKGKQNIELTCKTPYEPVRALTDKTRLRQILINLLGNAVKFTQSGSIEYGYERHNDHLKFFVKDSGVGIEQNKIDHIFKRFNQLSGTRTRRHGGAGLGLSISKACVELLGGTIWAESEFGKGTTFYFTIEYINGQNHQESNKKSIAYKTNFKSQHILIAEDDDVNFQYFETILKHANLQISRAATGDQVLEKINTNADIDLILMDIRMPEPNGLEVTKILRNKNINIPIIIQTAYAFSSDRKESLKAGANEYISKPINKNDLYKLISNHLA
ncbi:MAG: PAS domain S-box protein [Bacteroidales bacterium]|nr:PAS domain S-box protein [Bacteroidales bacterium]